MHGRLRADGRKPPDPATVRAPSPRRRSCRTSASGTRRARSTARSSPRWPSMGFLGAPIPDAYGGAGADYISFALLCEELERADTAFRVVQSRPRRTELPRPPAVGHRGAAPALARSAGERREARHVRPHGARRGHRRGEPRSRPPGASMAATSSTARRSGSASPTSRTTSSRSRPWTGRRAGAASPRSSSSGA